MQRTSNVNRADKVHVCDEPATAQRPGLNLEIEVLEARIAPAYFGIQGGGPLRLGPEHAGYLKY